MKTEIKTATPIAPTLTPTTRSLSLSLTLSLLLSLGLALWLPVPASAGGADTHPSIRTENGRVVLEGATDPQRRRQQVRTWYRRWRREIAPVHRAVALVERVLRDEHPSALPGACRILGRALLDFDRPDRWPAPDYALHRHLRNLVDHLTRATTACLTDRRTATGAELRRAHRAQGQAKLVLQRWIGRTKSTPE